MKYLIRESISDILRIYDVTMLPVSDDFQPIPYHQNGPYDIYETMYVDEQTAQGLLEHIEFEHNVKRMNY